jgi:hypothetical protein
MLTYLRKIRNREGGGRGGEEGEGGEGGRRKNWSALSFSTAIDGVNRRCWRTSEKLGGRRRRGRKGRRRGGERG